jgi:outer membrane immunogenic protein
MRKLTVTGLSVAMLSRMAAADGLPPPGTYVYTGPPPTVQLYTWSGLYIGGDVGGGWIDSAGSDNNGTFIGGAHVGFNLRAGKLIYGLEAQWTGIGSGGDDGNGSSIVVAPDGAAGRFKADIDWIATLAARVGVVWDRSLFYVKVGPAWGHQSYDASFSAPDPDFNGSETRFGWAAGLGYEYAFRGAWSVRLEYLFTDLGSDTVVLHGSGGSLAVGNVDSQVHAVTFSLNYRFDWPTGPLGTSQ